MLVRLNDVFNLLSKLTLRRIWNILLVYLSFMLSRLSGKPLVLGRPFSISFEPTTACNLACPECPSGQRMFSRPTGKLDPAFFRQTIDQIHRDLLMMIFYFQGEPFLHPRFLEMVQYASSKKIYTITSTNAHFIDDQTAREIVESGLDRLIISLDGITQEVYENYRVHGNLEKVLAGAERVVHWKKELRSMTPYTIFQFLVVRPNEHQIDEARELARQVGVDEIKFKSAQIYDYRKGSRLIPANPKYSRYRPMPDGSFEIKNKMANHCWKMWHSNVITWDGKVVPCCFDKDAKYQMGDLKKNDFFEIWESAPYQDFRQKLSRSRGQIDICTNCTEGTKVWVL